MTELDVHSLSDLAAIANGKNREIYQVTMTMLYAGIAAGEALIEAKARIPHGEWMPWCKANLEFTTTTCASYMSVARNKEFLLAQSEVTTMQKAIRCLQINKLTTQSRIDDARVEEIRATAEEHGVYRASQMLGEHFGVVKKYADGTQKMIRSKPSGSGTRVAITDEMIERLSAWMCRRFSNAPKEPTDALRKLALEALQAALGVDGFERRSEA